MNSRKHSRKRRNVQKQGFQSFFMPSAQLTAMLLDASLNSQTDKVSKRIIQYIQRDQQQNLMRMSDSISRCFWQYLGTLGQRSQDEQQVTTDELMIGLQDCLDFSYELIESLIKEFVNWLNDDCHGQFLMSWGEIVLSEDRILLKHSSTIVE